MEFSTQHHAVKSLALDCSACVLKSEVRKVLRGASGRLLTARLQLRGKALSKKARMEPVFFFFESTPAVFISKILILDSHFCAFLTDEAGK